MSRGNTNNKKPRTGNSRNSKRGNVKNRNDKTKTDKELKDKLGTESENDFNWYNVYPQLTQDAGRLSFFNPLGSSFRLGSTGDTDATASVLNEQVAPGVMALHFSPCFSKSSDFGSQINIAARNIYSYIRSTNSGAKNYDPADLMMYLIAMDSAYMYYAWIVRLYGMLMLYTPTNKYYPNGVFAAIDVDYSDLQSNITALRGYINMFGAKLGKLCVPAQMSLTKRHQWMCSNIFLDSNTQKAQSYIFTPSYFYYWSDSASDQGSSLHPVHCFKGGTAHMKFSDITNIGETIVNGLMSSQDVGTISGDILRAYGTSSIYKIGTLLETYQALPIYSQEALIQIHNATLLKSLTDKSKIVSQSVDKQAIITGPEITLTWNNAKGDLCSLWTADRILNLPMDNSDAAAVFISSRLTTCLSLKSHAYDEKTSTHTATFEVDCCGTEILTGISIVGVHRGYEMVINIDQQSKPVNIASNAVAPSMAEFITDLQAFKYPPTMYLDLKGDTADAFAAWMRLQELDNYTVIGHEELKRIHEVALLSELSLNN